MASFIEKLNASGAMVGCVAIAKTMYVSAITADGHLYAGIVDSANSISLSKYKANGSLEWKRSLGAVMPTAITVDDTGNPILWGKNGTEIAKFSSGGSILWHLANLKPTQSITTDASGNIYVSGVFSGAYDFDPGPGTNTLTAPAGTSALYIQKFDAAGHLVWAKQRAVTGITTVAASTTDAAYIYLSGNAGVNTMYGVKVSLCN